MNLLKFFANMHTTGDLIEWGTFSSINVQLEVNPTFGRGGGRIRSFFGPNHFEFMDFDF
jgi:hypothetical protein